MAFLPSWNNWNFSEIKARAASSLAHRLAGGVVPGSTTPVPHWISNPKEVEHFQVREHFKQVTLELDDALSASSLSLSALDRISFWSSWDVWNHLHEQRGQFVKYCELRSGEYHQPDYVEVARSPRSSLTSGVMCSIFQPWPRTFDPPNPPKLGATCWFRSF